MPIVRVQTNSTGPLTGGLATSITFAQRTEAENLLVVTNLWTSNAQTEAPPVTGTPTDSAGNTYLWANSTYYINPQGLGGTGGAYGIDVFYCPDANENAGTVTNLGGFTTWGATVIHEYSGIATTSPLLRSSGTLTPGAFGISTVGPFAITGVTTATAHAPAALCTYNGTFTGGGASNFAGLTFVISGFTNAANNGTFLCVDSSATVLTMFNPNASAQTHAATATQSGTTSPAVNVSTDPQNHLIYTVSDMSTSFGIGSGQSALVAQGPLYYPSANSNQNWPINFWLTDNLRSGGGTVPVPAWQTGVVCVFKPYPWQASLIQFGLGY